MAEKTTTQLRLDDITFAKIKIIADRELRSMNNQIEYFLKKGIEQYEIENGGISVQLGYDPGDSE